jgi:hypothetical protein
MAQQIQGSTSPQGNETNSQTSSVRMKQNLAVLQRNDPHILSILDTTAHVAVYIYTKDKGWVSQVLYKSPYLLRIVDYHLVFHLLLSVEESFSLSPHIFAQFLYL